MKRKSFKLFVLYYFIIQFTFAIASVQRIPYLKEIGYSGQERSFILSSLALASILGQLAFGYISDKSKRIKKFTLIAVILFATFSFFIYNSSERLFIYHFLFVVLSGAMQNVLGDLNDSWAMQSSDDIKDNLSFIKSFESFGYASGALIGSTIISLLGYKFFATVLLFLGILAVATALFIDEQKKSETTSTLKIKDILALLKSKAYMMSMLLFMTFFTIIQIHAIALVEKILFLGGNETHIAFRVVISVGLEGVGYIMCNKLYRKIGPYKMLLISSISYITMYSLFIIAKSPTLMVLFSAFQMLAIPFYTVAMKNLVFKIAPDHLKTSSQLFMTACLTGIAGTLTPLFVSPLQETFGYNAALYLAIGLGLLTIVLNFILRKVIKQDLDLTF